MTNPCLSICIATYNRAGYIGETLDSIIPQLDDEVELLVVDGGSTDNTENVMMGYINVHRRIRYVRLPSKGGVDQDYDKSIQLAHGEFCWLFTDDDLLRPGAVAAVKKAIKEGHDLVVVNAEMRNRGLSSILKRQRISIQEDKIYGPSNMEGIFIDALAHLSFIGAVVIRRSVWLSRDRESYFGTEFIHVGVIFQKSLSGSAFIIAEPYIICRLGTQQWLSRRFEIWMFKWPKLVWSFNHISKEAKLSVTCREPWRNFMALAIQRSVNGYDIQSYHQYFSAMQVNVLWKFCALIIACFPRNIIVGFRYLYSRRNPVSRASFENQFCKTKE